MPHNDARPCDTWSVDKALSKLTSVMWANLENGSSSAASVVTKGVTNIGGLDCFGPTRRCSINLIHGIAQISSRRAVEMTAPPKLPVVIGELTGPWVKAEGGWDALRKAQAAAANRPEFTGNVSFVPTHDFVRKAEDSPNTGYGHHEFGNAETYFLVGHALGKGMLDLISR